jgi:mRNA interferase RelE/StbE
VPNPYHVKIAPTAHQQIARLAPKHQKNILKLIEALAINPRPPGAAKIEGMTGLYCQEMTPVRLVYKIEEQEVLVLVVK